MLEWMGCSGNSVEIQMLSLLGFRAEHNIWRIKELDKNYFA